MQVNLVFRDLAVNQSLGYAFPAARRAHMHMHVMISACGRRQLSPPYHRITTSGAHVCSTARAHPCMR